MVILSALRRELAGRGTACARAVPALRQRTLEAMPALPSDLLGSGETAPNEIG
jgi:hypothetical protein